MSAALTALGGLAGCEPATLSDHDEIYSHGADHFVLCSENIDDKRQRSAADIGGALDRAKRDGTTVHFYAHRPGEQVSMSTIETVLAGAAERELELVTYDDLTTSTLPGSVALSFDDHDVATWMAVRPLLSRYNVRVTFFLSSFATFSDDERAAIAELAGDGHDIEFHSVNHLDAVAYVNEHGADAYLADEILPGLAAMRTAGYTPVVFAYPGGFRSEATDAALMPYFHNLRAIRTTCPN